MTSTRRQTLPRKSRRTWFHHCAPLSSRQNRSMYHQCRFCTSCWCTPCNHCRGSQSMSCTALHEECCCRNPSICSPCSWCSRGKGYCRPRKSCLIRPSPCRRRKKHTYRCSKPSFRNLRSLCIHSYRMCRSFHRKTAHRMTCKCRRKEHTHHHTPGPWRNRHRQSRMNGLLQSFRCK